MQIQVLAFGVLKERFGGAAFALDLPDGATVEALLDHLSEGAADRLRGIAVSVNAEYARPGDTLSEGDEVGLLPPVSGGAARTADGASRDSDVIYLTRERIDAEKLVTEAKAAEDGAVVVFDGIVRNHSRGRQTLYLDYEAYEEMALKQMRELAATARERFGVRHVTLVHRLGRLAIGETSVLIVVASAHRAAAYEASRWMIDTLKKTVPVWKKETFVDGVVWADGEPFPEGMSVETAEREHGA
jgi:MoaE-MoaD fusion protein